MIDNLEVRRKKSINDKFEELDRELQELKSGGKRKKEKKFKIPRKGRVGRAKLKKGYVTVMLINENKGVDFKKFPIQEGTILHEEIPHIATPEYLLNYKGKPFMILPTLSLRPVHMGDLKPFSIDGFRQTVIEEKNLAAGYRLVLNRLKSEQLKSKVSMGWGVILLILAAVGIGIWYLTTHKVF